MAAEGTQQLGVFKLIWSDYQAHCDFKRAHPHLKGESARMSALKAPIRMIINSSLRGNILVRCTCASPRAFHWFWRSMLLTFHSSEVVHGAQIGPRLNLPHPFCIGIGGNVRIGTGVTICQYTTIGGDLNSHDQPQIGDNAVILAGAGLYGAITIGEGAVVGANTVLMEDLAPGGVAAPARARVVNRRIKRPSVLIEEPEGEES